MALCIYCWVPTWQLKKIIFNYLFRLYCHTCYLLKVPAFSQILPVWRANSAISNESAVHQPPDERGWWVVPEVSRGQAPQCTPDTEQSKLVSRGHFRKSDYVHDNTHTAAMPSVWPTPGMLNPTCFCESQISVLSWASVSGSVRPRSMACHHLGCQGQVNTFIILLVTHMS